jgi:elongation factor P
MRPGMVIRDGGELLRVISADHHLGGGKMPGVVHVKLRSLRTARFTERRFRPEERFEEISVARRPMDFLYEDGDDCVFMSQETFEQVSLPKESVGPFLRFLKPELSLHVDFVDGVPVSVHYPDSVTLRVAVAPEPAHGQHDSNVLRLISLENGMEVLAPPFIKVGDLVKIDVESGKYLERVR